jgi:hypothetical protein
VSEEPDISDETGNATTRDVGAGNATTPDLKVGPAGDAGPDHSAE